MDNKEKKSLTEMYEEAFNCSSDEMKEYLEKRILILGNFIVEQAKIEHLYEVRDYPIDGFMVAEWDAFIEACKYFESKYEKK